MGKKILIIQFRRRPEMIAAEQEEYKKAISHNAEATFISALDTTLAWDTPEQLLAPYAGLILGGSGEFDLHNEDEAEITARTLPAQEILSRLTSLINFILANNFPTLGICFGHQLIAEVRGGLVLSDHAQKKVGTYPVALTEEGAADSLFGTLPSTFLAQYGHRNSVTVAPKGAVMLAQSNRCKFSALRYAPRVYTVQFHPELTAEDVHWKLKNSPGYLPEGDVKDFVKDSPEASTLIPLFVIACQA